MHIERIDGDTRTVYFFAVRLDEWNKRIEVQPYGVSIQKRTSPRAHWQEVTSIAWESGGSWSGYKAYDYVGNRRAPANHRESDLVIPDDVWAEVLSGFEAVRVDR